MGDEFEKIVLALTAGTGVYFLALLLMHLVGIPNSPANLTAGILSFIFCIYAYNEL